MMRHPARLWFPLMQTLLLAAAWLCGQQALAAEESPATMAARYAQEVDKRLTLPAAEVARYGALAQQMLQAAGIALDRPQYLVLVDRSPQVQALLLLWMAPPASPLLIGASPVSTGRGGEYDYFETPTGVFSHNTANPDFRAEGTFNEKGIRGFGLRGMRVFDFGWQQGRRGWGDRGISPMRLLLHATDPEQLEPRLGSVQSKGCVRIPASLNRLLDQHGLLDADYEAALLTGQHFWVLSPQRTPVTDAGRYLIVVDTQRTERPDWSPSPFLKTSPKRKSVPPPSSSREPPSSAPQGSNTAAPSMVPARNAAIASLACASG